MAASSNDASLQVLQTLEPAPPRNTTVSNREPVELSRELPGTLLWFNKWMDIQNKRQHMAEDLQRERDEEWTTLAKEKIDRKVKVAERILVNKTTFMQIRIAEGAKIEKELVEERQALLKKWREFDQNLTREKHIEQGVMLAELFKMVTDTKDEQREQGGCGKGADTHTPPESPEDPFALVHDPDESLEHPTKTTHKVVRFVEGTRSPGRQFDSPATMPASIEESARQLDMWREPDRGSRLELEKTKGKLKAKEELLERAKNNIKRTVDLASQFDTNVQQQLEIAQQQQLEIQRLKEENDRLLADSGNYAGIQDSDMEEKNSEEDIDIEGVSAKDIVLYLDDLAFYVVHCPSPCSLSWEKQPNISMEYFTAHLDQEHTRSDGTDWTSEDAEVECCILIADADFEWFAKERLLPEENEKTIHKGKELETQETENDSVHMTRGESNVSPVTSRLGAVTLSDKHLNTKGQDERSEEKDRLNLTLNELRRQNQYYSNERDRLRGVLETIKKQNRDLADKIKEIKNYQENVPEYKKMTNGAAGQAVQSLPRPDSPITNGYKRQRETLDDNGDEQTEADEPRPCKKLKTPELKVPVMAISPNPSPPSSVNHQDFNPALEREPPLCTRCSTSPDRMSQAKDTSKEAPSKATYVSPYLSPPHEMEIASKGVSPNISPPSVVDSAPKGRNRAFLQFNPDAIASMVKRQVGDTRMSLGGSMNHQNPIGPAVL